MAGAKPAPTPLPTTTTLTLNDGTPAIGYTLILIVEK
jgi:hypothetical protein